MPSRAGSHTRSQRGQSMVELTLVLPILLMVLLVSLDLGRAYFAYVGALAAAESGVRVAADPSKSDTSIRNAVIDEADGSLTIPDPNNNVLISSPRSSGSEVTVTVKYPFQIITPFVSAVIGTDTVTIEVSAKGVVM